MKLPKLPSNAAYLRIDNASRHNALSSTVLKSLRDQLIKYNTSPRNGRRLFLPPFNSDSLNHLSRAQHANKKDINSSEDGWLVRHESWLLHRNGLPDVLVLCSEGPTFSSGHDLKELDKKPSYAVQADFELCAEVMKLVRRCPIPIVGRIHGLATAAGAQLALSTDLPIACASTPFRLPGAYLGLSCISPSTALSRKLGNAFTYRMLALGEQLRADQLPPGVVDIVADEEALEARVSEVVDILANQTSPQAQAFGKWAYWTQTGWARDHGSGDGYAYAAKWAGEAMTLHSQMADAREGISSFLNKRKASWKSKPNKLPADDKPAEEVQVDDVDSGPSMERKKAIKRPGWFRTIQL
ncbi:ClpP/crotonase-like domain-containing protein [Xylariaceae sp. FL0016]|nr:ClpP/crotonase-like domain-containing protein [Xylariaceae sp. FL0016]